MASFKIANPTFTDQKKETLSNKNIPFALSKNATKFLSSLSLKIKEAAEQIAISKENDLREKDNKKDNTEIDGFKRVQRSKGRDALYAGKKSMQCFFIITEGDSAKQFADAAIGKAVDYYGVYPMKGKPKNVYEEDPRLVSNNEQIQDLQAYLFNGGNNPRYGHIIIMADQDHDGSHIKGLLMVIFWKYWDVYVRENRIFQFITPIVKIMSNPPLKFFSEQDYKKHVHSHPESFKYKHKYYKGLATSNQQEAREYFQNLPAHNKKIVFEDDVDETIKLYFSKHLSDSRKFCIEMYNASKGTDYTPQEVPCKEFFGNDFVAFAWYNCKRAIPNLIDGLKTSQRKIIYTMIKKNKGEHASEKVTQVAIEVMKYTQYHHGNVSIEDTISRMAQNFSCSNNVNLLHPEGMFGSRANPTPGSSRYVETYLSSFTKKIFPEEDLDITPKQVEDGREIEPEFILPIIPMCLVNGCEGIATGWSTYIPPHNPIDIIQYILDFLDFLDSLDSNNSSPFFGSSISHSSTSQVFPPQKKTSLVPWWKGWKGHIKQMSDNTFLLEGVIEMHPKNPKVVYVKEILPHVSGDQMALSLEALKKKKVIEKYLNDSSLDQIHFTVMFAKPESRDSIFQILGLSKTLKMTNLTLIDHNQKISQYKGVHEIIDVFVRKRLEYYSVRKNSILKSLDQKMLVLINRIRYYLDIQNKKISVSDSTDAVLKFLRENEYEENNGGFEYIYDQKGSKFSISQYIKNNQAYIQLEKTYEEIRAKSQKDMWREELNSLLGEFKKHKDFERFL